MKRATTDQAKAKKATLILQKAYELYESTTFHELKMVDIAKAAQVSKGTLFNYFPSKEALFMEILFEEYRKRMTLVEDNLSQIETMTLVEFQDWFLQGMAYVLDHEPVYIRLIMIKNTILEQNIRLEVAMKDKVEMHDSLVRLTTMICQRVPGLPPEVVGELYNVQNALLIGFASMANMPKSIEEGIEVHNLDGFKVDLKGQSLAAMAAYMKGVLADYGQDKRLRIDDGETEKKEPVLTLEEFMMG